MKETEVLQSDVHQGRNLQIWRKHQNVKQEILAQHLGIKREQLSAYENSQKLPEHIIKGAASFLDIKEDWIRKFKLPDPSKHFEQTFNDSPASQTGSEHSQDVLNQLQAQELTQYNNCNNTYNYATKDFTEVLEKILNISTHFALLKGEFEAYSKMQNEEINKMKQDIQNLRNNKY